MEIKQNKNGNILQISLVGRLDAVTSPDLQSVLEEAFKQTISELIFDFIGLEYISSAGLRVILNAQKEITNKNSKMKLINVHKDVMDVFKITGFNEFLTIE